MSFHYKREIQLQVTSIRKLDQEILRLPLVKTPEVCYALS